MIRDGAGTSDNRNRKCGRCTGGVRSKAGMLVMPGRALVAIFSNEPFGV